MSTNSLTVDEILAQIKTDAPFTFDFSAPITDPMPAPMEFAAQPLIGYEPPPVFVDPAMPGVELSETLWLYLIGDGNPSPTMPGPDPGLL